ncbi:MAG TPA: hypothetical protein VGE17_01950 [Methylophilus sp.]
MRGFWLICWMWSVTAHAVTQISLTADSVSGDLLQLEKPRAILDLRGKQQQMTVNAVSLQIATARLDQPQIQLEVSRHPTLLITSSSLLADQYQARNPRILLDYGQSTQPPSLSFDADVKAVHDTQWGKFHLGCLIPAAEARETWRCRDGLYQDTRSQVPFSIDVTPSLVNAQTGQPSARGVLVEMKVQNAKFSDASGLHAGEKLTGDITLSAYEHADGWRWHGQFRWQQGELFWQPFYFAEGGKTFDVQGLYQPPYLDIQQAVLDLPGVGQLSSQSRIDLTNKTFDYLKVDAKNVDFAGVYQAFLQPMLTHSAFANLQVSGKADWAFEAQGLQPRKFHLRIQDANVADSLGKFAFSHFSADIPWDYDVPQTIQLGYQSGRVLNIPLGETRWQAQVNRYSITAPALRLPVLDGALAFEDVSAAWINQSMVWHVKMDMDPISLDSFSQALHWPSMRGQIDGHIPMITYANHTLRMDGDMQFTMFKGMVGMSDLEIDDPLGAVPKLHANLTMREIDLGEITRTFNFGSITGKLEGDVKHLRLQNWKPVYMDAMVQTADGPFEKKISQRAVENITALGGEGTAAALQRTFLRFFSAFGYEKIGLRCELRGDICKMGGVEATPTGFVILKGKGTPSVNVNGYTQYVSWKDVLSRMQRVTSSNTKVVID